MTIPSNGPTYTLCATGLSYSSGTFANFEVVPIAINNSGEVKYFGTSVASGNRYVTIRAS